MLADVKSFLVQKFWKPVVDESVYYNPYNTAVYAILFGVAALYLVHPFSKKIGIDFDRDFFLGIAPFIFLGGALRSLKDINAINTFLLETPFIYLLMFIFTVSAILLSKELGKRTEYNYHRILAGIGVIPVLLILPFYTVTNFGVLSLTIFLTAGWLSGGYLLLSQFKPELLSYGFSIPVAAHYWDATTSSVAIALAGAEEKHVLGRKFIELFGPGGMFIMKTAIIVPATYYVWKNFEGEERNYYLFLIALLGIALGTRNLLSAI